MRAHPGVCHPWGRQALMYQNQSLGLNREFSYQHSEEVLKEKVRHESQGTEA